MRVRLMFVLALASLSACSGGPTSPTPPPTSSAPPPAPAPAPQPTPAPAPSALVLFGLLTDGTSGGILPNIHLQITDGVNAGRTATTDSTGNYSMGSVTAGTFTLNVSATSYVTQNRTTTMTANTRVDITLQRVPPAAPPPSAPGGGADLSPVGGLTFFACFPASATTSTCGYNGVIVNQGHTCASAIRGTVVAFDNAGTQTGSSEWTYALKVIPGEQFVFTGVFLTLPNAGGKTRTSVTWQNGC